MRYIHCTEGDFSEMTHGELSLDITYLMNVIIYLKKSSEKIMIILLTNKYYLISCVRRIRSLI